MATTITAGNATNGAAISSDNTGILELKSGTGSGTTALTLNASQNATLAGTLGVGAVTSTGLVTGATGALYPLVSGAAQTAPFASPNTSCDFTGIPSWVKRITVMFSGVSLSGTSNLLIQIGSGSFTTSGYASTYSAGSSNTISSANSTAGFIMISGLAAAIASGVMTIQTLGSNVWVSGHTIKSNTTNTSFGGGDITLSGTLDRVRITTVNGTDTFDAGTINILYE